MADAQTARIAGYLQAARVRNAARVRSQVIIALLLALLLWETRWPSLRAGLLILLLVYLGSALWYGLRNRQLAATLEQIDEGLFLPAQALAWRDAEKNFLARLMLFENLARALGFLVLGYGFWVATGSILIALLLGVVYPLVSYFGMEQRQYRRRVQALAEVSEA